MDNFVLLGQARQPWLDLETLKTAFLERSSREHPDHANTKNCEAATRRYAELNAAYNCLREPKERLAHLLELEQGATLPNVQSIPAGAMELFAEVGRQCHEADRIIAAKAAAASPLIKAQWFSQGIELTERLLTTRRQIQLQREALLAELRAMNHAWNSAPPVGSRERPGTLPLRRLEEIYRLFSFTGRWSAQLDERLAQLSF